MKIILPGIAERLQPLRQEQNKTQQEMANMLECTVQHYQRIEYGQSEPPIHDFNLSGRLFWRHHRLSIGTYRGKEIRQMTFERITSPDHPAFDRAFALYTISFPLHEQRTREKQERVLSHPEYHFDVIWEGETFVGILLHWEEEGFSYVEHFATDPALRGQGLGARALELLNSRGKSVVLEIDPPVDELSIRRKGFYQRAGFWENPFLHVHPPYRPQFKGHPLTVMTYPTPWDRGTYETFWVCLRDTVMADCKTDEQ